MTDLIPRKSASGIGCAWTLLFFNGLLIGLIAITFARGPYSSSGQEFWYRYVSLGFFILGAAMPAGALVTFRRSKAIVTATVVWMIIIFVVFGGYVLNSGGGV